MANTMTESVKRNDVKGKKGSKQEKGNNKSYIFVITVITWGVKSAGSCTGSGSRCDSDVQVINISYVQCYVM